MATVYDSCTPPAGLVDPKGCDRCGVWFSCKLGSRWPMMCDPCYQHVRSIPGMSYDARSQEMVASVVLACEYCGADYESAYHTRWSSCGECTRKIYAGEIDQSSRGQFRNFKL